MQLHIDRRLISSPALLHRSGLFPCLRHLCVSRHIIMSVRLVVVLAVLTGVTGSPNVTMRAEADSADASAHPNSIPEMTEQIENAGQQEVLEVEEPKDCVMATGELNPNHYPARRAAQVVQHYLNTRYGSPYRWFQVEEVYSGKAEDVGDSGRKYQLEISVKEINSSAKEKCSAEIFFPRGGQHSAEVQASCVALIPKNDTKVQEEALYQQYKTNQTLLTAHHLPDSHGHIEPDMKPFWYLGAAASSFAMLQESNEDTLYNMAQVANVTQLPTEHDQLKFDYHILLHDMVSQEIIHWKLLFTWSPAEGVHMLKMDQLQHCHDCGKPPNTN